jgi:PAS domain S-box-containing protein
MRLPEQIPPSHLLDALMAQLEDAVVVMHADGTILSWNEGAQKLLGYASEEIVGRHGRLIIPKLWWPYWDERLAELRLRKTVKSNSVRQHQNGSLVDVEATTAGLFDSVGNFQGYFNIFKDLRRRNEEEVANIFLAALVRASPDAIISTDVNLSIRSWNAAAEHLFGFTEDEAIGAPINQFMPQLRIVVAERATQQSQATTIQRLETTLTHKSGRITPTGVVIGPLVNSAGVSTGWFVSCTDISERKKAEEHTRLIMAELSHRAKNLLTVITAMAASAPRTKTSDTSFEDEFSERLRGLARSHDLLVQSEWRGARLHRLIMDQLRPFIGVAEKRISIVGPDPRLRPDATQCLGLAFHELATNATKYGALAGANGVVSIDIDLDGDDHVLTWTERGGEEVRLPVHEGFGTVVIQDMISETFGTQIRLSFDPEGLVWSARLPARFVAHSYRLTAA